MYYSMDWTYILVLFGAAVCALASANVNGTFRRYSKTPNARGLTGKDTAELILRSAGINDVRVEHISGSLTDHYSPGEKVLRLSDSVYNSTSVAAVGVAAHECGHAVQHQVGYFPLTLRSISVPLARIGSYVSWPLILIGLLLGATGLARIGVVLFSFVVIFQLITLPVEFNASSRALKILQGSNYLSQQELSAARSVLTAAALTYVAALFSSILQLLRLFLLTQSRGRRR